MNRWNESSMLSIGTKLFEKIHKQKFHSHHNHDIHFLARDMNWLPEGIQSIVNGNYTPQILKRYYFPDEMVDQLHISDRILQNILLKIVKPTFKHVMNINCHHLEGPTGVKNATQKIRDVLKDKKPKFFIRADIKSFYKSISHSKLINDIKQLYDDPKLITMLENIIRNPIDTPYGYKNPDNGIALRGPLSQFFSGIYLKPLDDSMMKMDVDYFRFQDDVLILCKTKRQLNRCRRLMMNVLHERRLSLSSKKTRIGSIDSGFHFLGIAYPPTQIMDSTNTTHANDVAIVDSQPDHSLSDWGGVDQLLLIGIMTLRALFRIREHYVRHANRLNQWSKMESLSERSELIYFAGFVGG